MLNGLIRQFIPGKGYKLLENTKIFHTLTKYNYISNLAAFLLASIFKSYILYILSVYFSRVFLI